MQTSANMFALVFHYFVIHRDSLVELISAINIFNLVTMLG